MTHAHTHHHTPTIVAIALASAFALSHAPPPQHQPGPLTSTPRARWSSSRYHPNGPAPSSKRRLMGLRRSTVRKLPPPMRRESTRRFSLLSAQAWQPAASRRHHQPDGVQLAAKKPGRPPTPHRRALQPLTRLDPNARCSGTEAAGDRAETASGAMQRGRRRSLSS